MSAPLKIGALAAHTGVPAKTIRYYEEAGVLPPPERLPNGYRVYDRRAVDTLHFVARARRLGFSLDDVRELLALWADRSRASSEVRALAEGHVRAIEKKIAELEAMRDTVRDLMIRCHGDDRPECPIIDELAAGETTENE